MSEFAKPKAKRADRREPVQAALRRGDDRLERRIRELEQTLRQHVTLRKLSGYLKASLTAAETYAAIECFGPQLFDGASGKLYLVHPPGDYLEHVASWGDASPNESTFTLRDCWALRRAQPHCVREARNEPLCGHVASVSKTVFPYLCVPLIAQGKLLGLLHVQRLKMEPESSEYPSSMESGLSLAAAVAEEVGLALSNLNLRETLHEQSIRDPLTGLHNRRFLEDTLIRELARAKRKTHALSIVLLDIDYFKRINDTFGHGAGDMVLRRLGLVLQAYVRESDIACRVGGEEFALLLPEGPLPVATQRAEDIRKAVSDMTLKNDDQDLGVVTVSLGVATFPDHGTTADALIRTADQVLYEAKRKGRNRVVSAGVRRA
jgi:diguanylate cyclase (GGDEF)-like protein